MGMFDYIRCEPDTPDGWKPADGLFQSKDLDCDMATHTITSDGRLLMERITRIEEVPKAERDYPDAPDDDIRSLAGCIRRHREQVEASDFHGWLNFYAGQYVEDPDGNVVRSRLDGKRYRYVMHDYRAKFTDGKLVEIAAIPSET